MPTLLGHGFTPLAPPVLAGRTVHDAAPADVAVQRAVDADVQFGSMSAAVLAVAAPCRGGAVVYDHRRLTFIIGSTSRSFRHCRSCRAVGGRRSATTRSSPRSHRLRPR